jgi:pterin-4a-carbinolamine dehydratase
VEGANNMNALTIPNRVPIPDPKKENLPVVPQNRWTMVRDGIGVRFLTKDYSFDQHELRRQFIVEIMDYEMQIGHHANVAMTYSETRPNYNVCVELYTRNINQPTNIDMEMARFLDILYKDLTYNQVYAEY